MLILPHEDLIPPFDHKNLKSLPFLTLRQSLKSSFLLCVGLSLIKILFSSEKTKSCDVMS